MRCRRVRGECLATAGSGRIPGVVANVARKAAPKGAPKVACVHSHDWIQCPHQAPAGRCELEKRAAVALVVLDLACSARGTRTTLYADGAIERIVKQIQVVRLCNYDAILS